MEIDDSPLMNEVDKVIEDGPRDVYYRWEAEFKIKDTFEGELPLTEKDKKLALEEELNEKIYKPLKFLSFDTERDYEKNYGDYLKLRAFVPYGTWVKVLFIAREHLLCTITKTPLIESTYEVDPDREIVTVSYDCIPQMREDLEIEVSRFAMQDKFTLDTTFAPLEIDFELLDRSLEMTRKVTMGAIVRKQKPEDVIKGIMTKFTEDLEIDEGKAVEKITLIKPDNDEEREHFLIPHGTKILDVPNFIQNKCGGVFSTGLNTFFQNNQIYIYPIANLKRFDEEEQTLTVIRVPENRYTDIERTYKLDDKRLTVLATSESKFSDINKAMLLKEGNGVRYADARKFMNKITETKDNKSTIKRKDTNHEYLSVPLEKQNSVEMAETRIHSNPFKEYSKQAKKDGGLFSFVWQNADISLLYPGMPVKVLYSDQEDVKELQGVLLKVHGVIQSTVQGMAPSGHISQASLFVYAAVPEEVGK